MEVENCVFVVGGGIGGLVFVRVFLVWGGFVEVVECLELF